MKTLLNFYFLTALLFAGSLQAQNFEWARTIGGSTNDNGHDLFIDNYGNVYVTGEFRGTVDFDPGPGTFNLNSIGTIDVFVSKYNSAGNLLWAKSFGGGNINIGYSISVDQNGNVYISGIFEGTVDFDPGPNSFNLTSAGNRDIFILKLDTNGNFIWACSIGASSSDYSFSITTDIFGNIYTTGNFNGTVDFNPGSGISNLTSSGNTDVFILKLDSLGNFLWAKSFAGINTAQGYSITVDTFGNTYATGFFEGTVDFDPNFGIYNLTSGGFQDFFVLKLDAAGNLIWAKSFGAANADIGTSISLDGLGYLYTTGYFEGTVDFDPSTSVYNLNAVGFRDIFILKLDTSGNFVWAKNFGNVLGDYSFSITNDSTGNVYTTGSFIGTVDFDPGAGVSNLVSQGNSDIFILKLDSAGNYIWSKSIGGINQESGNSIKIDLQGNVYSIGYFEGTVDFDTDNSINNITSIGGRDIYIHKIRQCENSLGVDNVTACGNYVWIDGNNYFSSNNTATYTIPNAASNGCDSIITLNLIINNADTTVVQNGITISAAASVAQYQWLDCDNAFAPISGETGQSFSPTVNGSYALQITENGCTDISSCYSIVLSGLNENDFAGFKVYPNPAQNIVFIDFETVNSGISLRLYAADGRCILNRHYNSTQLIEINLSEYASGLYLLELMDEKGMRNTVKIVKE